MSSVISRAGQRLKVEAGLGHLGALLPDRLPFARGQVSRKASKLGIVAVPPVILLAQAQQAPVGQQARLILRAAEGDMRATTGPRRSAISVITCRASARTSAGAPGRTSRRRPVTGVNGTALQLRDSSAYPPSARPRPSPSRTHIRRRSGP